MKTHDQVFIALGKLYDFQKKLGKFRIREKQALASICEPKKKWGQPKADK